MTRLNSSRRVAIVVALSLAGCSQSRNVKPPETVAAPTEVVRVTAVPDTRVTTGTVRPATVAPLASRLLGNITRVLVNEGDRVRAGQVLVEIDGRDVIARSEQARAAARGIEEAIASASASIDAAQANANLADATYKRFAALRERGSVSPQEFEEVAAKQKGAQVELERARRGHAQLVAQRAQAFAAIAEAETFLSYTAIRSPIDGIVSARFIDPGAQAAPGMPLLTVEGTGRLRVDTTVSETLAARVRAGDSVDVDGISARVANVAPVDAATRSAIVKVELPPASSLQSGSFVHVAFPIGTRDGIVIPRTAIARSGQLASVFVVDDQGVARMRLVTLGDSGGERVEVLSGIDAGERIVSAIGEIRDGVRVRSVS